MKRSPRLTDWDSSRPEHEIAAEAARKRARQKQAQTVAGATPATETTKEILRPRQPLGTEKPPLWSDPYTAAYLEISVPAFE